MTVPKKYRKMLGDADAPSTVALRLLIGTQSKATIRKWCLDYAQSRILPIFQKHCPDAYDRAGLGAADEIYAQIAEEVCADYINALRAVAVEREPHPAKLK